jgi:hypothetical protein
MAAKWEMIEGLMCGSEANASKSGNGKKGKKKRNKANASHQSDNDSQC